MYLPGPELLLSVPGEDYTQQASSSHDCLPSIGAARVMSSTNPFSPANSAGYEPDMADEIFVVNDTITDDLQCQHLRPKKQKQWSRWTNEVIPSLVQPYLHLLRISESMQSIPHSGDTSCHCNSSVHHLKIVCVYLESEFIID